MMFRFLSLSAAMLALSAIAGCGGGGDSGLGDGGPLGGSNPTGSVTLALSDAPLSQLATFSLEITGAVMKGTGATQDATIFPTATSAATMSVDLLSLQGLNQLFAQATVPVGNYGRVEIAFSSVTATDLQNVAQNVTALGNTLVGVFAPAVNVTANSTSTIQVDVDLSNSVFDLGGNDVLFAPSVVVTQTNQPIFLHAFPAAVVSVDAQNDRFVVNQLVSRLNSRLSGSITVQCDANTVFFSLNPPTATPGSTTPVSQQVGVGDNVLVKGSLLNGVVVADRVSELSTNVAGPARTSMGGVITAVDTNASTLTFKVLNAVGTGTLPARFSDVTVAVSTATLLHRGRTSQQLGDFTPGNTIRAALTSTATGWDANKLNEEPSMVRGVVNSVTANAGVAQGTDLLSMTPEWVEQIPVPVLGSIVPNPLTADVPANRGLVANDPIRIFGFFDGTAHFQTPGHGHPIGIIVPPHQRPTHPVGPGNNPPNPPHGPNPPAPQPPHQHRIVFGGDVAASTTATVNTAGDIEFTLAVPFALGSQNLAVTVLQTANLQIQSQSGIATATVNQAVAALNATPSHVIVSGTAAPIQGAFEADLGLKILVYPAPLNPAAPPATGGGSVTNPPNAPSPQPGPPPAPAPQPAPPPANTPPVSTPPAPQPTPPNTGGGSNTNPQPGPHPQPGPAPAPQPAPPPNTGGSNTNPPPAPAPQPGPNPQPQPAPPPANQPPNGGGSNTGPTPAPAPVPAVNMLSGTVQGTATVNANGDIEFTLVSVGPVSSAMTLTTAVTVSQNALLKLFTAPSNNTAPGNSLATPPTLLTVAQAVAALNASPRNVSVIGTHTPSTSSFACTVALRIFS